MSTSLVPTSSPIGGYFGLETSLSKNRLYESACHFQSARAAFAALLETGRPSRVWMPRYICDAMLSPLVAMAIEVCFYDLTEGLRVGQQVNPKSSDWLLYVNYFGTSDTLEQEILKRFDPMQLVFDHAQALFSAPQNCLATIFSPRKFMGVPDGGLLFSKHSIKNPPQTDNASILRCQHLLLRADGRVREGYTAFKTAEDTLADSSPKNMSLLSQYLFRSADIVTIAQKRRENFQHIHDNLGGLNRLDLRDSDSTPMCYPLWLKGPVNRARLAEKDLLLPAYWHEVLGRCEPGSVEQDLVTNCIPLPCDQRYDENDIERMLALLRAELKTSFLI